MEQAAVKENGRTVHHRDGSTSTKFTVDSVEHVKETYSEWITRQIREAPDFARQVLGKSRFEFLRAGKTKFERMVVEGRVKRLAE